MADYHGGRTFYVFAVPYFAAIDQILKTVLSATQAVLVLAAYNLAYALPFTVVPLLSALRTTVMGRSGSEIPGLAATMAGSFQWVMRPRNISG